MTLDDIQVRIISISRDFADLVANSGLTNEDNVLSVTELQPIKCRPTFQLRCMTQVVPPLVTIND